MKRNRFSSFPEGREASGRCPLGGLSHVRGEAVPELVTQTIGGLLDRAVEVHGDHPACVFVEHGIRWRWRELAQEVDCIAASLLSLGVGPGDRVGIWSPNRPEWVLTLFATARIGAVLVNINPAYRSGELEYALNNVEVQVLISAVGHKTSNYLSMLEGLAPELLECEPGKLQSRRLSKLRSVVHLGREDRRGMFSFQQLRALAGPAQFNRLGLLARQLTPYDPINIQFTSGTTGRPKGATLTHHNIVNNARFVAHAMRLGADDRLCVPVPLYHCFGMVMGVLACAATGSCLVFPGESFDPGATLSAIAGERCTALHGVPTMFVAMLGVGDFGKYDLGSLRTGIMAGAPCPVEIMRKVVTQMHMQEVTIAYGMTETSPVSFQSAIDDPLDLRVTTVGRVQPHLDVKVIGQDGKTVAVGEPGELCTRGYSVMKGYWGDADRTAETVRDGWMHTGDLVTIDRAGYCRIVGRVKDMIIRGGENVYPREIEEFLLQHPKVADAQVFGVPDQRYGEEVAAWIILKAGQSATQDEIKGFCRDLIAHYKVPRHIRFVNEMPMTITGKVQKFAMRDAMCREFGLVP